MPIHSTEEGLRPLRAADLKAGDIVWLPSDADTRDPETFKKSKIGYGALDHPVLILAIFGETLVTNVNPHFPVLPLPRQIKDEETGDFKLDTCDPCNILPLLKKEKPLTYEDLGKDLYNQMSEHSHVGINDVWVLSVRMLRHCLKSKVAWDHNEKRHASYSLSAASLEIVKQKTRGLQLELYEQMSIFETCVKDSNLTHSCEKPKAGQIAVGHFFRFAVPNKDVVKWFHVVVTAMSSSGKRAKIFQVECVSPSTAKGHQDSYMPIATSTLCGDSSDLFKDPSTGARQSGQIYVRATLSKEVATEELKPLVHKGYLGQVRIAQCYLNCKAQQVLRAVLGSSLADLKPQSKKTSTTATAKKLEPLTQTRTTTKVTTTTSVAAISKIETVVKTEAAIVVPSKKATLRSEESAPATEVTAIATATASKHPIGPGFQEANTKPATSTPVLRRNEDPKRTTSSATECKAPIPTTTTKAKLPVTSAQVASPSSSSSDDIFFTPSSSMSGSPHSDSGGVWLPLSLSNSSLLGEEGSDGVEGAPFVGAMHGINAALDALKGLTGTRAEQMRGFLMAADERLWLV